MFTNFIFIIIAILVYSTQFPEDYPSHSWPVYLVGTIFLISLYAYTTLRFFQKRLKEWEAFPYGYQSKGQYQAFLNRHMALGLVFYAALLYLLELKTLLAFLPSETLQSVLGIAPFFLFLAILWSCAYPLYNILSHGSFSRVNYVFFQVRFNLPVILPWLIATLFMDLSVVLPEVVHEALKRNEWTHLFLYAMFFIFLGTFFPVFVKTIWGCEDVRNPDLLELLSDLCKEAGVTVRNAIMWPIMESQAITAGIMGIVGRFRFILLTPSIVKILDREELKSVLAHELGHSKNHHLHFYLIFFMGYAILSYLYPDIFFWSVYWCGLVDYFPDFFINGNKNAMAFIFFGPMVALLLLYFRYLFGFFSRNFERQADLFSLSLLGSSEPLVSSLNKVAYANGIDPDASNWHHYGIKERVEFVRDCERQPELATAHHKKVFQYKSCFIAILLVLFGLMVFSKQYSPFASMKLSLMEAKLLEMAEADSDKPELHLLLAEIRLERNNHQGAVESYRNALRLEPADATALNNLAWILLTSEDRSLLDYPEGLRLAEKAAALQRKPHILDTLAEAYFTNGAVDKAIVTEEEALKLETGDKSHYKKQLEKFRGKLTKR